MSTSSFFMDSPFKSNLLNVPIRLYTTNKKEVSTKIYNRTFIQDNEAVASFFKIKMCSKSVVVLSDKINNIISLNENITNDENLRLLIKICLEGQKLSFDLHEDYILKSVNGLSLNEIRLCLNNAVLMASENFRKFIIKDDIIHSVKTLIENKETKIMNERLAIHQIGHVLISHFNNVKINCVSLTDHLQFYENKNMTIKEDYVNKIKILISGVCAEKIIYGNFKVKHSELDLGKAKEIAYSMVELGFTERISRNDDLILQNIEKEVYNTLEENTALLKYLASELVIKQNLSYTDIKTLIKEKKILAAVDSIYQSYYNKK